MQDRPTALERAFQLARSGEYGNVSAVRAKLVQEGFGVQQICGRTLIRQLSALCIAHRVEQPEAS